MRINARRLLRGVGTQSEHAARHLIHQLEGLKIQRFASAGEQGIEMFQQRRHDQLIAIASGGVEQAATQFFDVSGL